MKNKTGKLRCIPPVSTVALLSAVLSAVLAGFAVQPGCSGERDQDSLFGPAHQVSIVVDAVLYVDRRLPEIIVTRTRAANIGFTEEAAGVNDAEVTVIQGLAEYRYESVGHLGRYLPPPGAPKVLPNTEYRLRVNALGREVRGATTTPARIEIDEIAILEETSMEVIRRLDPESAAGNKIPYRQGLIEVRFDPLDVSAYQVVVLEGGFAEGGSPPWKRGTAGCGCPGSPSAHRENTKSKCTRWTGTCLISFEAWRRPVRTPSGSAAWRAIPSRVRFQSRRRNRRFRFGFRG